MKRKVSPIQHYVLQGWLVLVVGCFGFSVGGSIPPNITSTTLPLHSDATGAVLHNSTDPRNSAIPSSITLSTLSSLNSSNDIPNGTTLTPTDSTDTKRTDTNVNLAIIPGLAVLIAIIGLCIKGCQWFTAYARSGDNEMYDKYATILHEGDDEYDSVDFRSESMTNSNYDTVSSMCSMMRKSPVEEPSTSSSPWKKSGIVKSERLFKNQLCITKMESPTRKAILQCKDVSSSQSLPQLKLASQCSSEETSAPFQGSVSSPSQTGGTISLSSIADSSFSLTVEDENAICKSPRRNQQYKVSFVTEDGNTKPTNTTKDNNTDTLRPIIFKPRLPLMAKQETSPEVDHASSSLQKQPSESERCLTSLTVHCNTVAYRVPLLRSESETVGVGKSARSKMVDSGTQTHKTSRVALLRSRRYVSESAADENVPPSPSTKVVELFEVSEGLKERGPLTTVTDGKLDKDLKQTKEAGSNLPHSRDGEFYSSRKRKVKCPKPKSDLDRVHKVINDNNIEMKTFCKVDKNSNEKFQYFPVNEDSVGNIPDETEMGDQQCHPGIQYHDVEVHSPPTDVLPKSGSLVRSDAMDCVEFDNDTNGNHLMQKTTTINEPRNDSITVYDRWKVNPNCQPCEGLQTSTVEHVNGIVLTSFDNRSNKLGRRNSSSCSSVSGNETKDGPLEIDPLLSESSDEYGKKMDYSPASDLSSSATSLSSGGCAETISSGSGSGSAGSTCT